MASDADEQQDAVLPKPRKRRRWGAAAAATATQAVSSVVSVSEGPITATATATVSATHNNNPALHVGAIASNHSSMQADIDMMDPKAKVLAMQESIRARLAAAKEKQLQQQTGGAGTVTVHHAIPPEPSSLLRQLPGKRPSSSSSSSDHPTLESSSSSCAYRNQAKRAKHFVLDLTEVSSPPKTTILQRSSTSSSSSHVIPPSSKTALSRNVNVNPYLAHHHSNNNNDVVENKEAFSSRSSRDSVKKEDNDNNYNDEEDNTIDGYDPLLAHASTLRSHKKRNLTFVEPGMWQQVADRKRERAAKAEASGYVSGRKTGHTITSSKMAATIYGGGLDSAVAGAGLDNDGDDDVALPRFDTEPIMFGGMPLIMEWWDVPLLPSRLRKEVGAVEESVLVKHKAAITLARLRTKSRHHDDSNNDNNSAVIKFDNDDDEVHNNNENNNNNEKQLHDDLRKRCYREASLANCKTSSLVQHIVPIQAHNMKAAEASKQPVLHLTKKELKRQRKLRRQARQRELQDMQAAGLVPAPEPRLTLKNFIQVMGDQAFVDPSKIEQKVQEQMEARQRAHMNRNEAAKLTKEQRSAKLARKLEEDMSSSVSVAVFYVLDTSHPFIRAKIDLNAQQNNITGGVLECEVPRLSCVICEGGPKAIKRYRRLMEIRMNWTGPDTNEIGRLGVSDPNADLDEGDSTQPQFNPLNQCHLVWQGMALKRHFKGFVFQSCETAEDARKILKSKGIAHYWDQVFEHHKSGRLKNVLQVRLAADSSSSDDEISDQGDEDSENIVMRD